MPRPRALANKRGIDKVSNRQRYLLRAPDCSRGTSTAIHALQPQQLFPTGLPSHTFHPIVQLCPSSATLVYPSLYQDRRHHTAKGGYSIDTGPQPGRTLGLTKARDTHTHTHGGSSIPCGVLYRKGVLQNDLPSDPAVFPPPIQRPAPRPQPTNGPLHWN